MVANFLIFRQEQQLLLHWVQGTKRVMADSAPACYRIKRVLFPTFGNPTIPIFTFLFLSFLKSYLDKLNVQV